MNIWFENLREEVAILRERSPLSPAINLSEAHEWQRRIIGGSIIAWLEQHGPGILQERQVLHKLMNVDPAPGIVFTSNIAGLLAAQEIIEVDNQEVLYLHEKEFQHWLKKNPDPEYKWHVHFWSFFREPTNKEFASKSRKAYPLNNGSVYWQHSEGTMWGPLAGRGVEHLWQWDGVKPVLLEEAFQSWVS